MNDKINARFLKQEVRKSGMSLSELSELGKEPSSSVHGTESFSESGCHAINDLCAFVSAINKINHSPDSSLNPSHQRMAFLNLVYVINWLVILLKQSRLDMKILTTSDFVQLFNASAIAHNNLKVLNFKEFESVLTLAMKFSSRSVADKGDKCTT